ncbi:methyltransferase domain-containing protein [Actinoplanes sp. NPDC023801]|uniref:class I SAM-dependent methyltransferase n=1 Tax=Actinoplanes sp. NPDC023801 TaxID=3154595 RepID=UPI0033FC8147
MDIANTTQDQAWNGAEGQHWADHADQINAAVTGHLLEAAGVGPRDRLLDIGCGTGRSTRAAARLATEGEAVGLDLSAPMLDRATRYAKEDGLTNVRFTRGDAQVHPFPAGRFDVAISQFGVMFFADPVAAFANIRQALRPGGRLAFVCPQPAERCEWYQAPSEAFGATGRMPDEGMFALADPDLTAGILTAAGYQHVDIQPLTTSLFFGRDVSEAVAFFTGSGPARALLESGAVTEADVVAGLGTVLRRYADETGVRIPGRHWLVRAERGA